VIVCGWCDNSTEPGRCSYCGRDPALPWLQRGLEVPGGTEGREAGRPRIDAGRVRHRLRLARKELGEHATNAQLAEHLQISERTLHRWQNLSGR
jgi:hypothetical protein